MEYNSQLNIPYTKLLFELRLEEKTSLPRNKVSMIRGGMGEMLLKSNCIEDRNCKECSYEDECIVNRVLYTHMDKKPNYVTSKESVGYLIECDNYQVNFQKGDTLTFALILFGKNVVHFPMYLQAFYMLGNSGLGKDRAQYELISIWNEKNEYVLYKNQVNFAALKQDNILNYIENRKIELREKSENTIVFFTPVTIKYQGNFINRLSIEPFIKSLFRRIHMMNYYINSEDVSMCDIEEYPVVLEEHSTREELDRYSTHQKSRMRLKGLKGNMKLDYISDELLSYILAGEILHIGKNTSFGFGQYGLR